MSVSYDVNGNLLTDNINTYTWNVYWGSPASVNSSNLIYDAFGRMVEQQNGSTYTQILYSPVGKTAIMNGQTLVKAFVGLPGGGTAIYNSSGLAYYRHADWLGSSRLTSTASRTVYSDSAYAPFGEQYALSGTADPSFTGQDSDTVSSLYDFTYREHSPSQGRWISPDPAGTAAVDPTSPQSWNRYAYVLNNPMSLVDPLGLYCNWGNGDYDDEDGGANQQDCESQGGNWIDGLSPSETAQQNAEAGIPTFNAEADPGLTDVADVAGGNPPITDILNYFFLRPWAGGVQGPLFNKFVGPAVQGAANLSKNSRPTLCGGGGIGVGFRGGSFGPLWGNTQYANTILNGMSFTLPTQLRDFLSVFR